MADDLPLREERLHFFGVGELERAEEEARGFECRSHDGAERLFSFADGCRLTASDGWRRKVCEE
jgi:hypothetical protein